MDVVLFFARVVFLIVLEQSIGEKLHALYVLGCERISEHSASCETKRTACRAIVGCLLCESLFGDERASSCWQLDRLLCLEASKSSRSHQPNRPSTWYVRE